MTTTQTPAGINITIREIVHPYSSREGEIYFTTDDPWLAMAWHESHPDMARDVFTFTIIDGEYDGDFSDAIDLGWVEGPEANYAPPVKITVKITIEVDITAATEALDALRASMPDVPVSPTANDYGCAAFVLCENLAVGWIEHPIIGNYPSCQRCADKFGNVLGEICLRGDDDLDHKPHVIPFDQAHYATPCNGTPRVEAMCTELLQDHIDSCDACTGEIERTAD